MAADRSRRCRRLSDHRFESRNGLTSLTRRFELSDQALVWETDDTTVRIPYSQMTKLSHITYRAQGIQAMQCRIRATGGRNVMLRSLHFAGIAQFEDRMESYQPFMRALIKRVAEHAPDARFRRGSTGLVIAWSMVGFLIVCMLGLFLFIAMDAGGSPDIRFVGAMIGLGFALIYVFNEIRRGSTRPFDPAKLDEIGLGEIEGKATS